MKFILKTLVTGAIGLPTVMWHGMGDHAESNAMHHIKKMILGKPFDSLVLGWVHLRLKKYYLDSVHLLFRTGIVLPSKMKFTFRQY